VARFDDIAAEQAAETDRAVARIERRARALHEAYRREIIAALVDAGIASSAEVTPASIAPVLPALQAIADRYAETMRRQLAADLASVSELAAGHVLAVFREYEPGITHDAEPEPPADDPVAAFMVTRMWRQQAGDVEARARVAASGHLPGFLLVRNATAVEASATSAMQARARMVADMEARRVYSERVRREVEAAQARAVRRDQAAPALEPDAPVANPPPTAAADPYLLRIAEIFDNRNHPISRVLHGKIARIGEDFTASVAEVRTQAALMKKRMGGIVWMQRGGQFVGRTLPAHYADRGRIMPWRASWEK